MFPSRSHPCCDMSGIIKDAVVEYFHIDATMLDLRICNRKIELHEGGTATSIALFSLVHFLS